MMLLDKLHACGLQNLRDELQELGNPRPAGSCATRTLLALAIPATKGYLSAEIGAFWCTRCCCSKRCGDGGLSFLLRRERREILASCGPGRGPHTRGATSIDWPVTCRIPARALCASGSAGSTPWQPWEPENFPQHQLCQLSTEGLLMPTGGLSVVF